MSIERDDGTVVISCDHPRCRAEERGEPGDRFEDVWRRAKRKGWSARPIGRDWVHGCAIHGATIGNRK